MISLVGRVLGDYRLEQMLGAGSLGVVYRATHIRSGARAAVKVLNEQLIADAGFADRFRGIVTAWRRLSHPHVVRVEDAGEERWQYYIAMEYLEFGTLRSLLARRAEVLPLARGVEFVRQTAEALSVAHSQGVIHRDLKPENVMIADAGPGGLKGNEGGSIKIADWGLAQLIDTGMTMVGNLPPGSPGYMSPEQCRGTTPDARSDIYSLGVLLYEVSVGYPPFQVTTLADAIAKHLESTPPAPRSIAPEIPTLLEAIILRCISKAAGERYQTAGELANALRDVLATVRPAERRRVQWRDEPQPPPIQPPSDQGPRIRVHLRDEGGGGGGRPAPRGDPERAGAEPMSAGGVRTPDEVSAGRRRINVSRQDAGIDRPTVPDLPARKPNADAARAAEQREAQRVGPPGESKRIKASLDRTLLTLIPGQPAMVRCTILNAGKTVDTFPISIEGVPGNWVQLPDAGGAPHLNPGERASVGITVLVPRAAESHAGVYKVTVRVSGLHNDADAATVPSEWTVLPFAATSLTLAPSRRHAWRMATFGLTLRNDGNIPAKFVLSGTDEEQLLRYHFGDPNVTLAQGGSVTIGLQVESALHWIGSAQTRGFTVRADPVAPTEGMSPGPQAPTMAAGQYVRRPVVPLWVPPVLALVGIGAFLLLKDRNTIKLDFVEPQVRVAMGATLRPAVQVTDAKGQALPDTGLTWSVADTTVAVVGGNGQVQPRKLGRTTVRVSRGKWSKTAPLEVIVPVTDAVTVAPKALTLRARATAQLTATARDANGNPLQRDASWSSSDPSVVTVGGNGRVVAKDSGTATITATIDGKNATAEVTVQAAKGGAGSGADCIAYDPGVLKIGRDKTIGFLVTDGATTLLTLDNETDARRALALARGYKSHCYLGRRNVRPNRNSFINEYWAVPSGASVAIEAEDCVGYNRAGLSIKDLGAQGLMVVDGRSLVIRADTREDAQRIWEIAQQSTRQCFIGRGNKRPNERDYIVQYWK